jgi:transmembrane sensor
VGEGRVDVRLTHHHRSVQLAAGQGVRYGVSGFTTPVQPVDVTSATAWRRGKLIFNHRPLAEVVLELERYQFSRIVFANGDLRAMPVTGVFDLDDPDGTMRTIEQTLAIKVTRLPLVTILS